MFSVARMNRLEGLQVILRNKSHQCHQAKEFRENFEKDVPGMKVALH